MKIPNYDKPNVGTWQEILEKKEKRRAKKKKRIMRVSGAGVKNLQKIIIAKKKK